MAIIIFNLKISKSGKSYIFENENNYYSFKIDLLPTELQPLNPSCYKHSVIIFDQKYVVKRRNWHFITLIDKINVQGVEYIISNVRPTNVDDLTMELSGFRDEWKNMQKSKNVNSNTTSVEIEQVTKPVKKPKPKEIIKQKINFDDLEVSDESMSNEEDYDSIHDDDNTSINSFNWYDIDFAKLYSSNDLGQVEKVHTQNNRALQNKLNQSFALNKREKYKNSAVQSRSVDLTTLLHFCDKEKLYAFIEGKSDALKIQLPKVLKYSEVTFYEDCKKYSKYLSKSDIKKIESSEIAHEEVIDLINNKIKIKFKFIKTLTKTANDFFVETGHYPLNISWPMIEGNLLGEAVRTPLAYSPLKVEVNHNSYTFIREDEQRYKINLNLIYERYALNNEMPTNIQLNHNTIESLFKEYYRHGFVFHDSLERELADFSKINKDDFKVPAVIDTFSIKNYGLIENIIKMPEIYNDLSAIIKKFNDLKYPEQSNDIFQSEPKKFDLLPLEVDDYKNQAISLSLENSTVIYGPPGTGKSEVITELLANIATKNQKILVVAEKDAALQVLIKRLNHKYEIDDFALKLNDNSFSNKKEFWTKISNYISMISRGHIFINSKHEVFYDIYLEKEEFELKYVDAISAVKEVFKDSTNIWFSDFNTISDIILQLKEILPQSELSFSDNVETTIKNINQYKSINELNSSIFQEIQLHEAKIVHSIEKIKNSTTFAVELFNKVKEHYLNEKNNIKSEILKKEGEIDVKMLTLKDNLKPPFSFVPFDEAFREIPLQLDDKNLYKFITAGQHNVFNFSKNFKKNRPQLFRVRELIKELKTNQQQKEDLQTIYTKLDANFNKIVEFINNINVHVNEIYNGYIRYENNITAINEIIGTFKKWEELSKVFDIEILTIIKTECIKLIKEISDDVLQMELYDVSIQGLNKQYTDNLKVISEIDNLIPSSKHNLINSWFEENSHKLETIYKIENILVNKWDSKYQIVDEYINSFAIKIDEYISNYKKFVRQNLIKQVRDEIYGNSELRGFYNELLKYTKLIKSPKKLPTPAYHFKKNFIHFSKLFPMIIATPLEVSKYLPQDAEIFDYGIFDESSQMYLHNALTSIHRCKRVVIAGDEQQLRPSNFFKSSIDSDDIDEYDDNETSVDHLADSLLQWGQMRYQNTMLKMHYRSSSHKLIEFSNINFYDGELIALDSPSAEVNSITLRKIDGKWDSSKKVNITEAEETLLQTMKLFNKYKEVGIITMNKSQTDLLIDMIEDRSEYGELIDYYNNRLYKNSHKRLFIKNIENVQGDEAEAIVFSLCYSKNDNNTIHLPNSSFLDSNRLNVAITRAKHKMVVVSSFTSQDIGTSSEVRKLLNKWLTFLEKSHTEIESMEEKLEKHENNFNSVFEEEFFNILTSKLEEKYLCKSNYVSNNYEIDIVVFDKNLQKFVGAIELDGARYHSSFEQRRRDWEKTSFLESLNWPVIRVWSTMFWKDKDECVNRTIKKLNLGTPS